MPELPEVETIRRDLQKMLAGATIAALEVRDPAVLTGISPSGKPLRRVSLKDFEKNVLGKRVRGFSRRGKYLLLEFDERSGLIFHLRMTGQLVVRQPSERERIIFRFEDGTSLCFADVRRFGEVFFSGDWSREKRLKSLGVEPLNGEMTASLLKKRFRGRTASIHALLLDQRIVAGVGNIYAQEALYLAGIPPHRSAGRLTAAHLEKLVAALQKVLSDSIRHRGYSMRSYLDANGQRGNTQVFAKIYGKDGAPCGQCGNEVKRKVISGRGVAYCSFCQRP